MASKAAERSSKVRAVTLPASIDASKVRAVTWPVSTDARISLWILRRAVSVEWK